jgi:hypothetical protein
MFIFDEILYSVSFVLLNVLVVNTFILFHELSRNWKRQLRNIVRNNKSRCWCITDVDLLKTMNNTQTILRVSLKMNSSFHENIWKPYDY